LTAITARTQLRTQQLRRPERDPQFRERPKEIDGTVDRHNHPPASTPDYYTQPGNLFRLMTADAKQA